MASWTLVKHLDNPAAWLHMTVCSRAALSQRLSMSRLKAREGGAVGRLRLATLLNEWFRRPGAYSVTLTVLISMHPIPSGRPGGLDELILEEASSVRISFRVSFCDGEIQLVHLLTQPIMHRNLD